ncbi:MAG: DUF2220 domain-containing protein [Solobacterium sp.]|nr:DUF2220 domain-containing protein [Solobacterium sp.]MDY5653178.1 DUF2220 family protein [Erysipelotrichaceae bacterium]
MNKYEVKIVNALLKKYYKRKSIYKDNEIHRRIVLPIDKVLKDYASYNVSLEEKELVNNAVHSLETKGFISSSKLKLSDDYQKLYLEDREIDRLEEFATKELGIIPRSFVADELYSIIEDYKGKGPITDFYINEIKNIIQNSSIPLDSLKEEEILKALAFLESNKEFLYIREASMLIYGDSKYLEISRRSQVCSVISRYLGADGEEVFEDENLLERFNIYDTDQEICIKGPFEIEINGRRINIDGLSGGVSFSIKDINQITNISVNCEKVMTIENKTSFLRMNERCCYIYLGGFATKPQIAFIKKLISNNLTKEYMHFGDIDAGGFWIHKKLCQQAGKNFKLFHMSKSDLENNDYHKSLKQLTEADIKRLSNLKNEPNYSECIVYMLKNNVKLEQEIISLNISNK